MAERSFSWAGMLVRMAAALLVVVGTWNPSRLSFVHWAFAEGTADLPVKALVAAILLAAWVLCIRTALTSLGGLGVTLSALILGTLVWTLASYGILRTGGAGVISWIALVCLGLVLGLGLSWSLIRQRITGQVEVD